MRPARCVNGIANLIMAIAVIMFVVSTVWGTFNQGWPPWGIVFVLGAITFSVGIVIAFVAHGMKHAKF